MAQLSRVGNQWMEPPAARRPPPTDPPAAYALTASSPAINAGRVVTGRLRGMGTRDYFGTSTPQGVAHDIGADER